MGIDFVNVNSQYGMFNVICAKWEFRELKLHALRLDIGGSRLIVAAIFNSRLKQRYYNLYCWITSCSRDKAGHIALRNACTIIMA